PSAAAPHHRGEPDQSALREVLPRPGRVRRRRGGDRQVAGGARRVRTLPDHLLVRSGVDAAAPRGGANHAAVRRPRHAQARLAGAGGFPMAAYMLGALETHDTALAAEYRKRVPATIAKYGGKFLVRGGAFEQLEGSWQPTRLVLLEFPSLEQAKRWYDSEEYREPKAIRLKASKANLIMVEGA